jgi:hypothetical protein
LSAEKIILVGFTWIYLDLPGYTWIYLDILGFTWIWLDEPEKAEG